jgi:hypothetical protein
MVVVTSGLDRTEDLDTGTFSSDAELEAAIKEMAGN